LARCARGRLAEAAAYLQTDLVSDILLQPHGGAVRHWLSAKRHAPSSASAVARPRSRGRRQSLRHGATLTLSPRHRAFGRTPVFRRACWSM